jgi:sodium/potassium-transporting ATPase subunit alpha
LVLQSNNDEQDTENFDMDAAGMREMVDIAALNSRVKFEKTDIPFDQRNILGDATETGLTRFAGRYLPNYDDHHKKHPKVFEVPFNSINKWALVIVSAYHGSQDCFRLYH